MTPSEIAQLQCLGQQATQNLNGEPLEEKLRKHGKMVKVQKCLYHKKVIVIYNPNSGKKRNVRREIVELFSRRNI